MIPSIDFIASCLEAPNFHDAQETCKLLIKYFYQSLRPLARENQTRKILRILNKVAMRRATIFPKKVTIKLYCSYLKWKENGIWDFTAEWKRQCEKILIPAEEEIKMLFWEIIRKLEQI